MKYFKHLLLFLSSGFIIVCNYAQNVSLNLLTQNSGIVSLGGTVFLQVDVTNTDPTGTVAANKVRPQISVPNSICSISATGHILPAGWTIVSNSGSVMRVINTTDPIPANAIRTLLISIQGTVLGGPSQISGSLGFNGPPPSGNNTADDISSSSIEVTDPTPVTLTDFNAALINCQPVLKWTTETEINSGRFEIERANQNSSDWVSVGVITAGGNSTAKVRYSFIDNSTATSSEKVLYRLKIIDRDGHYKYSPVLPVFINCKTIQVHVYPNPVQNGILYVSLNGATRNADAALLSLSGQVILKEDLNNGTNSLNVSKIANGEYVMRVNFENGTYKKVKVIIHN